MQSPWLTFEINRPVLAFTLAVAMVSVLVAGLLPARSASRTNPIEALRDGARGYTGSAATRFMRSLVIGQIALTCTLLVASLLLVRSIVNRQNQPLGYDAGAMMTGRMNLETDFRSQEELRVLYPRLLSAFRATPGVTHAALTSRGSVAGAGFIGFEIEGRPTAVGESHAARASISFQTGISRRWDYAACGPRIYAGGWRREPSARCDRQRTVCDPVLSKHESSRSAPGRGPATEFFSGNHHRRRAATP